MIFKKRNDLKKIFKISLIRQNIRNLSLVKYALLQIKERYKIRVQRCTSVHCTATNSRLLS